MTILSNDRMVDVFPVVFDFKKGEQPSSAKLTKWVQLTDNAFSLVTRAVGDPWDYQHHAGTIDPATTLSLSPLKLSQPTLARTVGPSEYLSPLGESLNAGVCDTLTVTMNINGASSWFFGFPFVKATGVVSPQMLYSSLQLLTSDDFVFTGDAGLTAYFTDYVNDPRALTEKGEYYIDFVNGIIQTATPIDPADAVLSTVLQVEITNLGYIGAGPPWSTHNVIPIWGDDLYTGVSIVEDMAGPGYYVITLPDHSAELPRVGKPADSPSASMTGAGYPVQDDLVTGGAQTTFTNRPTEGLSYQLPYAIIQSFQDGDVFPDGVVLLWQNSPGRFIPLTEFIYNSPTQLQVVCPVLDDVFGTPNTTNYRLVVTGTSLAEQIGYLSAVVRENPGNGLAYGGPASFPSVTYSPPISHDRLRDRFSMTGARGDTWAEFIAAFESWQERFSFVESNVPTNPHPQYLHRTGWMAQDKDTNSGNAMRGELVFASQPDPYTGAGTEVLDAGGQLWDTWGVRFGGGPDDSFTHDRQNSHIMWFGSRYGKGSLWEGESFSESFNDLDLRLNFTNPLIGAAPWNVTDILPFTLDREYMYGALGHIPIWGTPLYLTGRTQGTYENSARGGVLAFDLGGRREMNFMKLMKADRALWNYAFGEVNIPTPNFSALDRQLPSLPKLYTSPDVLHDWHGATGVLDLPTYGRWSASQIREFRLRGVSENTMTMMGHQSIAAGEVLESGNIIEIDDMPVDGINAITTSTGIVLFSGNYLPHLFPGTLLDLSGTIASDGSYYVKWAFYLPNILTTTIDLTVVKVEALAAPTLASQSAGGYGICAANEMMAKFISPSMVGADYFNVYGNALFFSESGGGARTSFTDRGAIWLDFGQSVVPYIGDQTPSALFYHPQDADINPEGSYYAFTLSESGHPNPNLHGRQTRWPLIIGDNVGIIGQTSSVIHLTARADSPSTYYSKLSLVNTGGATLRSYDSSGLATLSMVSGGASFTTAGAFSVNATGNANLASSSEVIIGGISTPKITMRSGITGSSSGGFAYFGNDDARFNFSAEDNDTGFCVFCNPDIGTYPRTYHRQYRNSFVFHCDESSTEDCSLWLSYETDHSVAKLTSTGLIDIQSGEWVSSGGTAGIGIRANNGSLWLLATGTGMGEGDINITPARYIIVDRASLPTSPTGVTGALYLDGNTLKVSP